MKIRSSTIKTTLFALFALGMFFTEAAQPTECSSEIEAADVNGATLHYFECGQGEPLVFVHGSLGDLHSFHRQIETFAEEFHVIAYSRRYHPPNNPPQAGDTYALQLHVADLAALVRELEAGPAHIVGHSYGAYISLAFALEHPELVRSLVLGEPPVLPLLSRTSVGEAVRASWNRRVHGPSRRAVESGDVEEGLRRFLDGVLPGWFDQLPSEEQKGMVEKLGPEFRLERLTKRSAFLPPLSCEALGQLERPTFLVTGERSPAMFLLVTAELERCLKEESHVMIPEAGHVLQHENPAFFNEAVLTFLRRH